MKTNTKKLLQGIGSIIDIYPKLDRYLTIVKSKTPNDRVDEAWNATGRQIRDAASLFKSS